MRHPLRATLLLAVLGLAACGDDRPPDAAATLPPPASTVPAPASFQVATGPEDVVIAVRQEGGFVPPGVQFAATPTAMVIGDGRLLATGPTTMIYPGPLLPNILERSITPAGIQALLAKADQLGLLADIEYSRNDQVADAPNTVVEITVGGRTYRHEAYALGMDGAGTPDAARQHLQEFVDVMTNVEPTVGAGALGPDQPYAPAQYLIQAMPVDPATLDVDIEPTIVAWPQDAPVRLADASTCAVLPAAVAAPLFEDATTLTFFTDAGVTYAVTPVQQLPGRTC
jgi:hypothetical protein